MSATPLSTLITQLSEEVTTASSLCAEIKKTRHVGKTHTQLDLLEASLLAGPDYLTSKTATLASLKISSDETAQAELEKYLAQVGEIVTRLDHIAHPKSHKHHHRQQHRSLLFPDWDPVKHREMEDPHFGELRAGWERVRDGVLEVFGELERGGERGEGAKVEEEVVVKEEVTVEVKEENGVLKEEKVEKVEVKVDEVVKESEVAKE